MRGAKSAVNAWGILIRTWEKPKGKTGSAKETHPYYEKEDNCRKGWWITIERWKQSLIPKKHHTVGIVVRDVEILTAA